MKISCLIVVGVFACILQKACGFHSDCLEPLNEGQCGAHIRRYYFDPATGTCEVFTYGGCGGNTNNFATEGECRSKCRDSLPSVFICHKPVDTGLCGAAFPRYYFDSAQGTCKEFTYGGCGGNVNNFESMIACNEKCGGFYHSWSG